MVIVYRSVDDEPQHPCRNYHQAEPHRVWEILTRFEEYPEWNPFIIRAQGVPRTGERLTLTMKPGKRPMTFRPTVLEASENQSLEWLGRLGIPGIFDGQHRFELNPLPGGGTHLIQSEIFSGLLVPLMPKLLDNTREGFRRLNEALAHRAEEN